MSTLNFPIATHNQTLYSSSEQIFLNCVPSAPRENNPLYSTQTHRRTHGYTDIDTHRRTHMDEHTHTDRQTDRHMHTHGQACTRACTHTHDKTAVSERFSHQQGWSVMIRQDIAT